MASEAGSSPYGVSLARRISVIIPMLDEEPVIARAVHSATDAHEVIVVDGGSSDASVAVAQACGARVITAPRGRGRQLAAGAAVASGDVLLFLHADSILPEGFVPAVGEVLDSERASWGRFDLRFDDGGFLLNAIARLISVRSRISRVATGDQAIFVARPLFEAVGGIREEELFEDVDLCRRLKRQGRMAVPASFVVTSARRWRNDGIWRTTFLMWTMKLLYLAGVPASALRRFYADSR